MSQKCSECGRESPLGRYFHHYWGCVLDTTARTPLLSQSARTHIDYLNGPFVRKATGSSDREYRR